MFMRLIVYAEEAYAIYNDCVKDIEDSILEVQEMKLKPYWKKIYLKVISSGKTETIRKNIN